MINNQFTILAQKRICHDILEIKKSNIEGIKLITDEKNLSEFKIKYFALFLTSLYKGC